MSSKSIASDRGGQRAYGEFCAVHEVPLSFQPWWWDAVCGPEGWGAACLAESPGGVWPWFRARRWGLPVVQLPPYTTYAGPWLASPPAHWPSWKRLQWERHALFSLIEQLPSAFFFQQNSWPGFTCGLPLLWRGFRLTTRYTYEMPIGQSLAEQYAALKHTLRTELRHAEQTVEVVPDLEAKRLFVLYASSLRRRGLQRPWAPFARLVAALSERQQGMGWVSVCRRSGADVAGLLLAFDESRAAVVVAGRRYDTDHPGALHRLYWEAISFCAARGLLLDFEGSMLPGVERVFRAFGAQPKPYLQVRRWSFLPTKTFGRRAGK